VEINNKRKQRHWFLFNDILILAKEGPSMYTFEKTINLNKVNTVPGEERGKPVFLFVTPGTTYKVFTKSEEEKSQWIAEITKAHDLILLESPELETDLLPDASKTITRSRSSSTTNTSIAKNNSEDLIVDENTQIYNIERRASISDDESTDLKRTVEQLKLHSEHVLNKARNDTTKLKEQLQLLEQRLDKKSLDSREILVYLNSIADENIVGAIIMRPSDTMKDVQQMIAEELELGYEIALKRGKVPIKKAQFNKSLAYEFFKSEKDYLVVEANAISS